MQGSVAAPRRAPRHLPALGPGQGLQWAIDGYTRMFAALLVFAGSLSEGSGAGLVPSGSVLAAMSASPERGLLGDHDAMEPRREPWGLLEMWIADPDGLRICIVEVPAEHPLRRRA